MYLLKKVFLFFGIACMTFSFLTKSEDKQNKAILFEINRTLAVDGENPKGFQNINKVIKVEALSKKKIIKKNNSDCFCSLLFFLFSKHDRMTRWGRLSIIEKN